MEHHISIKYNELFMTNDFSDNGTANEVCSFFGVSRHYLEKNFTYHFFLKFGNVIIISLFLIFSSLMLFLYLNKSIDLMPIFVSSLSTSIIIATTVVYYRKFRLHVVLFIPLILAVYLLGIVTFYYKILGFDHRVASIFLGTLY